MGSPIVYVDSSAVRDGVLEELKAAIRELADFVADNEPRILAYNVYFSDDGTRMTVLHVHPDSSSLDYHLEVAGPRFGRFADLVDLRSIRIYGRPSHEALARLRDKARLLGGATVEVQALQAGFTRLGSG